MNHYSFSTTLIQYLRGQITTEEINSTEAVFLFNCMPRHAVPELEEHNQPPEGEYEPMIAFEALWAFRQETKGHPNYSGAKHHLIPISALPYEAQFRARAWNNAMAAAYRDGRMFVRADRIKA